MTPELVTVIVAAIAIAWANGSNDVSKGIATLVGSGLANYRAAIYWGLLFTAFGAIAGGFFAHAMVETFGGKLLSAAARPDMITALAIIGGAAGWVLFSTRTGLPVSTTHAIVGSLVGVILAAFGTEGVAWNILIWKVALPLLLSPLAALGATMILRRAWDMWAIRKQADCICVTTESQLAPASDGSLALTNQNSGLTLTTCDTESVAVAETVALVTIDRLHWLSAGLTSFARGMNDAPKLAGLVIAAMLLSGNRDMSSLMIFVIIAAAMAFGGYMAGLRVTEMLAEKVTIMNHHEGFTANLVTSVLVTSGAVFGLPMSTTHVSASALVGIGISGGKDNLRMGAVKTLLAAWVITLPGAAVIGMILFWLGKYIQG